MMTDDDRKNLDQAAQVIKQLADELRRHTKVTAQARDLIDRALFLTGVTHGIALRLDRQLQEMVNAELGTIESDG